MHFLNLPPVMQGVFTMMQGFLTEKMRKRNQVHQKVGEFFLINKETSWAGSATLRDTSWARLIFQLRPTINGDRLRHRNTWWGTLHKNVSRWSYLESKTEMSVAKAQDYFGGDTAQKKGILEPPRHCTYFFLIGWTIGMGMGTWAPGHRTFFVDVGNNWSGGKTSWRGGHRT